MSTTTSAWAALFTRAASSRDNSATASSKGRTKGSVASRLNWLRAAVLGANDGIVSISGLLVGVAAADPTNITAIVIAGVAGIAAAALSMSVGEYVSVSTQRDTERELVRAQKRALERDPSGELDRLAAMWEEKGLSQDTARAVAEDLTKLDPVAAHLNVEHNIDPDDLTNPWEAAFSSFLAFLFGAALPMVTMLLLPAPMRVVGTFASVLLALALTGWISAWLGEAPKGRAVIRLVVGGAAAMALTWGIGHIFGISI